MQAAKGARGRRSVMEEEQHGLPKENDYNDNHAA